MRNSRLRLFFLGLMTQCFLLSSHLSNAQSTKMKPMIVYEIFVQSFRDSNEDGIGDLQGVIEKLDYIRELGANTIWLMPVHPSPSYHKYDVTDYYNIHPDYGTMKDMEELIKEIHKRDMMLIMDFVVNHTSSDHLWFIKSAASETSPYHDYYVWRDYETVKDEIIKATTTFDSDNVMQWHEGPMQNERYYGFFWKGMPDLNFDNPAVREEIYKIGKFWIKKGVDGFRLDAAKHIYPDDRLDDTRLFWEEFTAKMKSYKQDIKIVGEVWSGPDTLATLFKGLPSLFNFEMSKTIPEMINSGNVNAFIKSYQGIQSAYNKSGLPFEDAILLNNHDMNRIRSEVYQDLNKSRLAISILMTIPGTAYLYYGEEIGMLGTKPDEQLREPFIWGDKNFQEKSWMEPVQSTHETVVPLVVQMSDEQSLYNHYKHWIKLRNAYPSLAEGKLEFIKTKNTGLLIYAIFDEDKTFFVVHNVSNSPTSYPIQATTKIISEDNPAVTEGKILVPPYTSLVLLSLGK